MNVHKHIQAGEGGVCVTSDPDLAQRLQLIRNHGENVTEWLNVENLSNIIGFNFRQTEIGAAISRVQLSKLEQQTQRCENIAKQLSEGVAGLKGITAPKVRDGCRHNYFMWSMKFNADEVGCSRDSFFQALRAEGVPVAQGYVPPIYRLPMFRKKIAIGSKGYPFNLSEVSYDDGICPVTERLHEEEIIQYQPVSWDPNTTQKSQMIDAIHKVHAQASTLQSKL
jgi:dTDP-4-amino-4,6-dideoxygalactose transaminase